MAAGRRRLVVDDGAPRCYRSNPATVAKAFQQLVDEQVLYKKRGIGMFVSPTARDALRARRREHFFSDVVDPMVAEARAVGIPLGDVVARIEHLADRDGQAGTDGREER
jgi:DNA-binding transcriptional regulator YhcF (GntR family)